MTSGMSLPTMPMTASSSTVAGSASSTSVARLMSRSVRPGRSAATSASGRPIPKATTSMSAEDSSGSDPAVAIRESRSRPSGSVPSRWSAEGSDSRSPRSWAVTS